MAGSTVEIIIQVTAANAATEIARIEGAIKGLGLSSTTTSGSVKQLGTAFVKQTESLAAFGTKVIGVLAGYTAFNQTTRMVADAIRSGIDAIESFNRSATNMAVIMTSLARTPGPDTFNQSLVYGRAVIERLETAGAKFGVTWKILEAEMRAFADAGVFPNSDKDIDAMARLGRAAQAMAVSRRSEAAAMMEIKQLAEGHVGVGERVD